MFNIVGKDGIQISRGDYISFPVKLKGVDDGESVIFSVTKTMDGDVLIEKTAQVENGSVKITLRKEDTAGMEAGKYFWDINLPDFWEEGQPHTPITPRNFQIVGVSHRV